MRTSLKHENLVASSWLLFMGRALLALLLAPAIVTTELLYLEGLVGMLGLYAVTDGVLTGIVWLRERRSTQFALEGALSIAAGFVMFSWSATATHLLVTFAVRALVLGALQALYAGRLHEGRSAVMLRIGAGISAAVGLSFLAVAAFGYDALQLYACIAGYLGIFGAVMLTYGIKLRARQRIEQARFEGPHAHHARPAR